MNECHEDEEFVGLCFNLSLHLQVSIWFYFFFINRTCGKIKL